MPTMLTRHCAPSTGAPRPSTSGAGPHERLLPVFVLCRTTLEDLSRRTAAPSDAVAVSVIAAYLPGRCSLPAATHNVVAGAINLRLRKLARPAAAPYRWPGDNAPENGTVP